MKNLKAAGQTKLDNEKLNNVKGGNKLKEEIDWRCVPPTKEKPNPLYCYACSRG